METGAKFLLRAASAVLLGVSTGVPAAGFQLIEQNASGLGNAYAGQAAAAENASTIFYNPAGMTALPGVVSGTYQSSMNIFSVQLSYSF